jgi:hypothetical protein
MLPRIAMHKPIDPYLNAGATCTILKSIDPVTLDLGHTYAHTSSVAYRIQVSSRRDRCSDTEDQRISGLPARGEPVITIVGRVVLAG